MASSGGSRSLLRSIESDLRSLAAEARKRHQGRVKEASDYAILRLKEVEAATSEQDGNEDSTTTTTTAGSHFDEESFSRRVLVAAPEVVDAIVSACDVIDGSNKAKLAVLALGSLHRLLTRVAIGPDRTMAVLEALDKQGRSSKDSAVVLKVVQSLIVLLTTCEFRPTLGETGVSQGIAALLQLNRSLTPSGAAGGSPPLTSSSVPTSSSSSGASSMDNSNLSGNVMIGVIEQTVEAAFRQICNDIFTSGFEKGSQNLANEDEHLHLGIARSLFRDLCCMSGGDGSGQIFLTSSPPPVRIALVLHVIEDALRSKELFAASSSLRKILKERLCPAIHKLMKSYGDRTTLGALMRVVVNLETLYFSDIVEDSEVILVGLVRMMETDASPASTKEVARAPSDLWRVLYPAGALSEIIQYGEGEILSRIIEVFELVEGATNIIGLSLEVSSKWLARPGVVCSRSIHHDTSTLLALIREKEGVDHALPTTMLGIMQGIVHFCSQSGFAEVAPEYWAKAIDALVVQVHRLVRDHSIAGLDDVLGLTKLLITGLEKAGMQELRMMMLSGLCRQAVSGLREPLASKMDPSVIKIYEAILGTLLIVGNQLNDAHWSTMFEALESLDWYSQESQMGPDEMKLKELLESLFSVTTQWPRESRASLIEGLIHGSRMQLESLARSSIGPLATRADPAGKVTVPNPGIRRSRRLFGLVRVHQVMSAWLTRKASDEPQNTGTVPSSLWQLLTGHLVSIGRISDEEEFRLEAITSLVNLSSLALGGNSGLSSSLIVSPINDILSGSYLDSNISALQGLHQLLESQGEFVKGDSSWTAVFQSLQMAVQNSDTSSAEPLVAVAFRSIQLIAGDFLPSLSVDTMRDWMKLLGSYGSQTVDVNVALAAVGLLWRTSDFLAKHPLQPEHSRVSGSNELWLSLFDELKKLSIDPRPDVRNGAVRTFTGAMATHGSIIEVECFEVCLRNALLPLLLSVVMGDEEQRVGEGAMNENPSTPPSPTENRRSQVTLHYSRDTPEKQWNETKVIALSGAGRVFKLFAGKLFVSENFYIVWSSYLDVSILAASSGEKELAAAGVASLLNALQTCGEQITETKEMAKFTGPAWNQLWRSLDQCVSESAFVDGEVHRRAISEEKALCMLTEGIASVTKAFKDAFLSNHSQIVIGILRRIVLFGRNKAWKQSQKWSGATEVQVSALKALESLVFKDDDNTWSTLVDCILDLIHSSSDGEHESSLMREALDRRAVASVEALFREKRLPLSVQNSKLPKISAKLTPLMINRNQLILIQHDDAVPLWAASARAFMSCVTHPWCLTDEILGNQIASGISRFLFPDEPSAPCWVEIDNPRCSLEKREWFFFCERYDIDMAQCMKQILSNATDASAHDPVKETIAMLATGAGLGSSRCRFAHECQMCLFEIADETWRQQRPSQMRQWINDRARSEILSVSDGILETYVVDERRSGQCPLPYTRRAEAITILRGLSTLQLSSPSPKHHLQQLFRRLCDCANSGDAILRHHTQQVLHTHPFSPSALT